MTIGTQIASLFAIVDIDDKLTPGLDKAKGGLTSFSDSLKDIGQKVTGFGVSMTAIGAPFLGVAIKAQQAFDEMDDAADQLNAVLKSTGGAVGLTSQQLLLMASNLQDLTGITRASILTGENMLLTFTNIGGSVFPRATKAALDLSVAMKQDMKSSAIQLGKALNSPKEGLTALTRVGVTFTEQQKAMITAMQDAGDIAGAQGIILTEIEREFGGSAAAAADPIDHLNALINDLWIDIGVSLQPALEAIIPVISDFVKGISMFLTSMSDNGDNTVAIILAIGAGLAILGPIIAAIGIGLSAFAGILAFVFSPIGLIIAGIVAAVLWMQSTWGDLFGAIQAGVPFVDILRVILFRLLPEDVAQGIVDGITNIRNWLGGFIDSVKQFVEKNPEFIAALAGIAIGVIVLNFASGLLTTGLGLLRAAFAVISSPVFLLSLALTGLLYILNEKYPGGLSQLLKDASTSARQLADVFFMSLIPGARGAQDVIDKAVMSLAQLQVIVGLLKGGQITLPQVLQQIGYELTGGDSAHQVISPSSGGGSRGFGGASSGITVNGPVSINANNTNQFESELQNRVRSRG